jgi:uncharacterized cysteine cluster protein YcgN (CxxCxxCC family)
LNGCRIPAPIACWRKERSADWHPLLTGSKAAMHGERISVRHIAVKESEVRDWEDHIMNHPTR